MEATLKRAFDKPFIEYLEQYAPIATPIAPAAVAIGGMYTGLYAQYGGFAAVPAAISGAGMEGTGYMAAHLFIKAIRRKDWSMAAAGLLFLVGYAFFAVIAMSVIENATMFQSFVAMSIITYLVVGALAYDRTRDEEIIEEKRRAIENERQQIELDKLRAEADAARVANETALAMAKAEADAKLKDLEIRLEHERTLQANAQARAAKAGQNQTVRRTDTGHRTGPKLNPETLAKVREYMATHETVSTRDLENAQIIGHSSAQPYIDAVNAERKK